MKNTSTPTAPPALVTEAKVVWAALVKTLRTAASDAPTAALYGPAEC